MNAFCQTLVLTDHHIGGGKANVVSRRIKFRSSPSSDQFQGPARISFIELQDLSFETILITNNSFTSTGFNLAINPYYIVCCTAVSFLYSTIGYAFDLFSTDSKCNIQTVLQKKKTPHLQFMTAFAKKNVSPT